jgi:hypothetical protein
MNIDEYKQKVIDLFKSRIATEEQWQEMASVVLAASESNCDATRHIDAAVYPDDRSERGIYANRPRAADTVRPSSPWNGRGVY